MTQQYGRPDYKDSDKLGEQRNYDRDYGQGRSQYDNRNRDYVNRDEEDRRQRDYGHRPEGADRWDQRSRDREDYPANYEYGRGAQGQSRSQYGRGGDRNFGSSKYGGSDYRTNDYDRNESRYGSPYSEMSNRQLLSGDERNDSNSVIASSWERTRAFGEWTGGPISTDYDEPYGRIYSGPTRRSSADERNYRESRFGANEYPSYRGMGPKGYERSDERIKEIICEALTEAPHIDASDITVEVKDREVKLTGSVRDRRSKYLVEELVEERAGANEIRNELRVKNFSDTGVAPTLYSGDAQNQRQTSYGSSASSKPSASGSAKYEGEKKNDL